MSRLKRAADEYAKARENLERAEFNRLVAIQHARAMGLSLRAIAKEVGVSFSRVDQILRGK